MNGMDESTWWGAGVLGLVGLLLLAVLWPRYAADDAAVSPGPARVRIEEPPNIVVIVIDTLRADQMSCYGYPRSTSPEIDHLARRGVRFAQVVAQSAWTRPSFASMLTSLYPRSSGISAERLHVLPDPFVTLAEVLHDAGYTTLGITANPNINSTFGFDQGFDEYVDSGVRFNWMREEAQESDSLYGEAPLMPAPVVFRRTLEMLDAHGSDGPVYLQIDLMDVHEKQDDRVIDERHRVFSDHPDGLYLSAIRQASAEIQRFIDTLEARPGFENTLFVITSDHGEGMRSHPHVVRGQDHGFHVYESQTLVPLVLYHSGGDIPRDRVVERPVRLLDLMPTLLDIAGVEGPDAMLGTSLVPLVNGDDVELPERFVVETQFRNAHAIGVYDDTWAYIEHRRPWGGTNPRELQRRGAPQDGRRTDRRAQNPEEAERLRRFLLAWEREHPAVRPTLLGREVPREELEQLRALGYIE